MKSSFFTSHSFPQAKLGPSANDDRLKSMPVTEKARTKFKILKNKKFEISWKKVRRLE